MATSSFTRKIIVTGKNATDTIIDALISEAPLKKNNEIEKFLEENNKRGRVALEKFVSLYKK